MPDELLLGRPSLVALDVSKRAIGLAGADPSWSLATPLGAIRRTRLEADLERLRSVLGERHAGLLVVGWPLELDGREGRRCQSVMAFANELERRLALPIVLHDERFTTFAAEEAFSTTGASGRPRRGRPPLDALAAATILEDFLDALRRRTGG